MRTTAGVLSGRVRMSGTKNQNNPAVYDCNESTHMRITASALNGEVRMSESQRACSQKINDCISLNADIQGRRDFKQSHAHWPKVRHTKHTHRANPPWGRARSRQGAHLHHWEPKAISNPPATELNWHQRQWVCELLIIVDQVYQVVVTYRYGINKWTPPPKKKKGKEG